MNLKLSLILIFLFFNTNIWASSINLPPLNDRFSQSIINTFQHFHKYNLNPSKLSTNLQNTISNYFGAWSAENIANHFYSHIFYSFPERTRIQGIDAIVGVNFLLYNLSNDLWVKTKFLKNIYINGVYWEQESPRTGVLLMSDSFESQSNIWIKLKTLIHELRHSDCDDESDSNCGFPHSICPADSTLDGLPACDVLPNLGGYYIEAIFLKALLDSCENCSATDQLNIYSLYSESIERVIGIPNDTDTIEVDTFDSIDPKGALKPSIVTASEIESILIQINNLTQFSQNTLYNSYYKNFLNHKFLFEIKKGYELFKNIPNSINQFMNLIFPRKSGHYFMRLMLNLLPLEELNNLFLSVSSFCCTKSLST